MSWVRNKTEKYLRKYLETLPDEELQEIAKKGRTLPVRPVVIVLERGRLTEAEIQKAFAGNEGALWYQALVSKIESMREDNLLEASRSATAGNELAMAGGLNVYEAFSGLLAELDGYVKATKS